MEPLKIFIGFDPVESVAYHTLCHSILSRASVPVSITPINLRNLKAVYTRQRGPTQSNEFSFTRFLVPYLCNYEGLALFMDCDMLVRADIKELFDLHQPGMAVSVVQHDYTPHDTRKYLDAVQLPYPRKNWSSVMLFNCGHPANRQLTAHYVNHAGGLELHRFAWLKDYEIGALPVAWNWLVGEYTLKGIEVSAIKNVHFTVGGPWFHRYEHVDFAEEWFNERARMVHCERYD